MIVIMSCAICAFGNDGERGSKYATRIGAKITMGTNSNLISSIKREENDTVCIWGYVGGASCCGIV